MGDASKYFFMPIFMMLFHEGGHFLTSLCFGWKIQFVFAWGNLWKIPIPRFIWIMPPVERWKQKALALSGFGAEFLAVPIFYALWPDLGPWYALAAVGHFVAYPFYAGEGSDFRALL